MQFITSQKRLMAALNRACSVASRNPTSPALASALIRSDGSGVTVSATDMIVSVAERLEATPAESGALSIKAHGLASMVKALPSGDVEIRALDNNWAQVSMGRVTYKVMGMASVDFPDLPDAAGAEAVHVDAAMFLGLIDKTLFSVSTDEARVNLNGALLEWDGTTATMVSTDGHRLTKYSVALEGPRLSAGIVIPRSGLEEIRKILRGLDGECSIAVSDTHMFIASGPVELSVKLSRVTFPPWAQVVPKKFESMAKVSRTALLESFRQSVVIAPSKTATTAMDVAASKITLSADNPEFGSVTLEVPAEWDGSGPYRIGVNGTYMVEALGVITTDTVYIRFGSELDPIVIEPCSDDEIDLLVVVMPMRI